MEIITTLGAKRTAPDFVTGFCKHGNPDRCRILIKNNNRNWVLCMSPGHMGSRTRDEYIQWVRDEVLPDVMLRRSQEEYKIVLSQKTTKTGRMKPGEGAKARMPKPCQCECGEVTKGGRFIPGHDSKLASRLLKMVKAGDSAARQMMLDLGWERRITV